MKHRPVPSTIGESESFTSQQTIISMLFVALLALNMRGLIVAPSAVLPEITTQLDIDPGIAGLIVGLPILCFSIFTPFSVFLIRRIGVGRTTLVSLIGLVAGTIVRSSFDVASLLIGSMLVGIFATLGNINMPVLIRDKFHPSLFSRVTGVQMASLNVGAMVTVGATAPIAAFIGWRWGLLSWSALPVLTVVALLATGWASTNTGRAKTASARIRNPGKSDCTWPISVRISRWLLAAAFAGQAFGAIGATAWLPSILVELSDVSEHEAGMISALFQLFAIVGALAVATIRRWFSRSWTMLLIGAFWAALPLGLGFFPNASVLWISLAGVGQGAAISLIFSTISERSISSDDALRFSAQVQMVGYTVAALAAPSIGFIFDYKDSYDLVIALFGISVIVMTMTAILSEVCAERVSNRTLPPPSRRVL